MRVELDALPASLRAAPLEPMRVELDWTGYFTRLVGAGIRRWYSALVFGAGITSQVYPTLCKVINAPYIRVIKPGHKY